MGNMSSEQKKAQTAQPSSDTVFGKILRKEIPCNLIYEDDQCIAFHDIAPQAPVHFLVVPRKPIPMLSKAHPKDSALLGHLLSTARELADKLKLQDGYRVVINNGRHGCQSVYHLHIHVLGGTQLGWPPV